MLPLPTVTSFSSRSSPKGAQGASPSSDAGSPYGLASLQASLAAQDKRTQPHALNSPNGYSNSPISYGVGLGCFGDTCKPIWQSCKTVDDAGGLSGFGRSQPRSAFAQVAQQVESDQEAEYVEMLDMMRTPTAPKAPPLPSLPGGGRFDELLLNGSARDLARQLVDLFEHDPAPNGGQMPSMVGRFHSYASNYGTRAFSPDAVVNMLGQAKAWWGEAPNVSRLSIANKSRLIIVGDTHGQLEDVLWMFFKYGVPSTSNRYLFVGDIVDRGGHALEILLLLFAFKREAVDSVHILRGNHEDLNTCSAYGFRAEIESKFGQASGGWVFHFICHRVMTVLPIAALVSDEARRRTIFVVHGGVPARCPMNPLGPVTIKQIEGLNRMVPVMTNRQTANDHLLYNLMWADPEKSGQRAVEGRGNPFTEQDTLEFCQVNQVSCVIRAHQLPAAQAGYEIQHQRRCWTVFSASNYTGNNQNRGGVLICDCFELNVFADNGPQPKEHWAPSWPQLADVLRSNDLVTSSVERRQSACHAVEGQLGPNTPQERRVVELDQLRQVELRAIDQICRYKQALHQAFAEADEASSGTVPLPRWEAVMELALPDMPRQLGLWRELAGMWNLTGSGPQKLVAYVPFLHRFQILSELGSGRYNATHVDPLAAMCQMRVHISDVACHVLLAELDRDINGAVDLAEFVDFLAQHGNPLPRWQAAAVYEVLVACLGHTPAVGHVLEALALISSDPEGHVSSGISAAWRETARFIGDEILKIGMSHLDFFRAADSNADGFVDCIEMERAIVEGLPSSGMNFDARQLQALVHHMDSQGVQNGKVSVVEFLRAVGSQKLSSALHSALLGEVLKPVYFSKAAMTAYLSSADVAQSGFVQVDHFRACLTEMNRVSQETGLQRLTDYQVQAVCEIASGGQPCVQYREFFQSLKAVDTAKRRMQVEAARSVMRFAFA